MPPCGVGVGFEFATTSESEIFDAAGVAYALRFGRCHLRSTLGIGFLCGLRSARCRLRSTLCTISLTDRAMHGIACASRCAFRCRGLAFELTDTGEDPIEFAAGDGGVTILAFAELTDLERRAATRALFIGDAMFAALCADCALQRP